MVYIIIGALTAILGFLLLWCWLKYIGPFTPLFEIGFLLAMFVFGYSAMFFCIGLFGDKKQTSQTKVEECVTTAEEDTSTYLILKIDTIFVGKKYDYNGELEYENR